MKWSGRHRQVSGKVRYRGIIYYPGDGKGLYPSHPRINAAFLAFPGQRGFEI
jgi:hypothetical protein